MLNVMIDLETSASRPSAGIFSIGAVAFDPLVVSGPNEFRATLQLPHLQGNTFYAIVDLKTQRESFDIDPSTFYWWLRQSSQAQEEICKDGISIRRALIEFAAWYNSLVPPTIPSIQIPTYAYGATFDHVVLQHAYDTLKLRNPIYYRNQLCMRTIVQLSEVKCPQLDGLVGHNALDDAIRQAIWIQECFKILRTGEKNGNSGTA